MKEIAKEINAHTIVHLMRYRLHNKQHVVSYSDIGQDSSGISYFDILVVLSISILWSIGTPHQLTDYRKF